MKLKRFIAAFLFAMMCLNVFALPTFAETKASEPVVMAASELVITSQPKDVICAESEMAYFTIKAIGSGITYKWQYSDNKGSSWSNSTTSSGKTDTYPLTASANRNGRLVRCVVTDNSGKQVTSNSAKLTVSSSTQGIQDVSAPMVVKSGHYIYDAKSSTTSHRAEYVTFGQEVYVVSMDTNWAQIKLSQSDTKTYYVGSSLLAYPSQTVIQDRAQVNPSASSCSPVKSLGYVHYGDQVSVLSTTVKNGVTYIHCIVPVTYNVNNESEVYKENVEGYISAGDLVETGTPMVFKGKYNIYARAVGTATNVSQNDYLDESVKVPVGTISTGEEVSVLRKGTTWTKFRYNGKVYYTYTNNLDSKQMQVLVRSVSQTADADPNSSRLHYTYWNNAVTVLDTFESAAYGKYYYCKVLGDIGFIPEYSSAGIKNIGYTITKYTNSNTVLYSYADAAAPRLTTLKSGTQVTVQYTGNSWSRVEADGFVGYVSNSRLVLPEYTANGKTYPNGYQLYRTNGDSNGVFTNKTVYLAANNSAYGYAYVLDSEGTGYWMKQTDLNVLKGYETVYTKMPSVALYASSNINSESFLVPYMTELTLVQTYTSTSSGAWSKVLYNGKEYYIWQYTGEDKLTDTQSSFSWVGANQYQNDVIALAKEILAWKTGYSYGQSSGVADQDGIHWFDCSGLAVYMLETVMQKYVPTYDLYAETVALYNTKTIFNKGYTGEYSATTLFTCTTNANRTELSSTYMNKLQPGDILFFDLPDESDSHSDRNVGYTHCGIYLGNGEFIHATRSWGGTENHPGYGSVCVMPLYGFYAQNCVGAHRYLPTPAQNKPANQTIYTNQINNRVFSTMKFDLNNEITNLKSGTQVTVLYTNSDNSWAYISYKEGSKTLKGYIQMANLSDLTNANATMYVSKTYVNLYKSNSTSSDSLAATVYFGDELIYNRPYAQNSKFYVVTYKGQELCLYAADGLETILTNNKDSLYDTSKSTPLSVSKGVNLRTLPSTGSNSTVIRMLKTGEKVYVLSVPAAGSAWVYIMTSSGEYGYVSNTYLS